MHKNWGRPISGGLRRPDAGSPAPEPAGERNEVRPGNVDRDPERIKFEQKGNGTMKKRIWKTAVSLGLAVAMLVPSAFAKIAVDESKISENSADYAYWDTSLSDEERAADLISHMTLEEKASQLGSHPAAAIPRLGVAEYWYPGENLNGIANISLWYGNEAGDAESAATSFPSTLSQGSTWNADLIGQMADAIGDEARAFYNTSKKGLSHWGPSVNLARDPRWGRTGDSFGEDVLVSGTLASAFIQGFQGDLDNESDYLKALACIKHFAANNAEVTRNYGSSNMSEAELREFYLRHFEMMVDDADPAVVMAAYNAINGIPAHADYELLTEILEQTWGFDGWVVSDNTGVENVNNNYGANGTNATNADRADRDAFPVLDGGSEDNNGLANLDIQDMLDGISATLQAGVDLDLKAGQSASGNAYQYYLVAAVQAGLIDEADLDEALLDVFTTRFATGEFDNSSDYTDGYMSVADFIREHQDLAEDVAEESIVLLENNDSFLPADIGDYSTIAVVGQYTEELLYSDYKSNNQWRDENGISVSFVDGIQDAVTEYNRANGKNVKVESIVLVEDPDTGLVSLPDDGQGGQMWNRLFTDSSTLTIYIPATRITMLSSGADAGEGNDRESLALPRGQQEIGEELLDICSNLVVALHTQSIVDIEWAQDADAVLWASYLGEKQGAALANVLFGAVSPSGRLTTTWYADEDQLGELQHDYTIYPGDTSYGRTYMYFTGDVTYPFGYGLSYADFAYSNFRASKTAGVTGDDTLTFTVDVKNTSDVDAYEVVQLYAVGPNAAQANRADKQLAGFTKVYVPAGETVTATVTVDMFDLAVWDETNSRFTLETGNYQFYLGSDCETKIAGCETTAAVTADITPNLKHVNIAPASYILEPGETSAMETTVSLVNDTLYKTIPADVTVTYTTSDSSVATVAADGTITAVGSGVCTITATATKNGQSVTETHPVVVARSMAPYSDVGPTSWHYSAVEFVTAEGMMNGVEGGRFAPDSTINRAMFLTVLARMAGVETEGGESWYSLAVDWAVEQGISDGVDPEGVLDREEMALMLYRFAGSPETEGNLDDFEDADQVSAEAEDALAWAVEQGLIGGVTPTRLSPQGTTTRAQMATILMRYCAL